MGSHLKYYLDQHESFRELLRNRDEYKTAFNKSEKSLNDKKEKLLKQKDLSKWGYQGEGGVGEIERKLDSLL
jgi:hypothetical protein